MKNIIAIVCVVLSVMTSCSSIESLTFDQLNPAAQANFPASVRQIAVVNNMPQIPDAANNIMTLGETEGDGLQSTSALASALADSKYFDEVIICDSALNHQRIVKPTNEKQSSEATAFPVHTLKQEDVTELCKMLNADMLFSLDRILINKEKKHIRYLGMQESIPVIRVKVTSVVSLHVPTRSKPIQIIHTTDSLDWTIDNVPSDKEMLKEAAEFGAHIMSNQLVPYWTQTSRIYYTGGMADMRDAAVCVRENDWESASEIWKSIFDKTKSKKVKMRTAFNIAVAHEMTGQLTEAEKWLDTAKGFIIDNESRAEWKYYSALLKERISKFARIKTQMDRF